MKRRIKKGGKENSETIVPFDLVIEILTRMPAKSVAKFHCLSKLYASTLDNPNFTETFFTISSSRLKLLFTCPKAGETFFFSSPKPHDSSPLAVQFNISFPINRPFDICRPVCGFVYGFNNHRNPKGRTVSVPLICNPSTGQSWTLPRVKTNRTGITSYFGYDPIDKQYKVLCMTRSKFGVYQEHQVLTFGTGIKPSWRMIKCDMAHSPLPVEREPNRQNSPLYDGICINGVLHYLAIVREDYDGFPDIVCFDIKSEKFSYIKKSHGMYLNSGWKLQPTLVNYKGKIAKLQPNFVRGPIITGIQLWVLEDVEKHKWSSYIYVLPPPWKKIIEATKLRFVGTSDTGEIVLSPYNISNSFYLLYYNPERNTITRVEIQGMEAFKSHKAYAFLDHVENIAKLTPIS